MTEVHNESYDFVIAGAGPAGLAAGITAARMGRRAVVLERGDRPGPHPRGEGVTVNPFLRGMLGERFFAEDCHIMDGSLVFHSPGDLKQARKPGKRPLTFFAWRAFMDRLTDVALKAGVSIRCNTEVVRPLLDASGACTGVEYRGPDGLTGTVSGHAVLACDGHRSTLGSFFKVPYDRMFCPMVKCMASDCTIDVSTSHSLQFFLIGNGDLPYAPAFPQCVAYAFPIGGARMELGLMLRMARAQSMETVQVPGDDEVLAVWNRLKGDYPGFSGYFAGARIEHEELTGMSNASLVRDFVPCRGLVLIGDSAGFIDPFGSSGICSGMAMAEFWVQALAGKIAAAHREQTPGGGMEGLFSDADMAWMDAAFRKTGVYRRIRSSYLLIGAFEWFVFKHLRTAERINLNWDIISFLLRLA